MANKIKYATLLIFVIVAFNASATSLEFGEKVPRICWINIENADSKEKRITIKRNKLPDKKDKNISCNY